MELTSKQKRYLRGLAHHRPVVVTVGHNGLSDSVLAEIDHALSTHELIKIRLPFGERAERRSSVEEICRRSGAAPVQGIGRVEVLYRPAPEPRIVLP
jgi:RNA-binding protein